MKPSSFFFIGFMILISCSQPNDEVEEANKQDILPTNLSIQVIVEGQTSSKPNGDGSGSINIIISATNTISYKVKFGDTKEVESTSGILNHTYDSVGLNNYTIEVFAFSSTGNSISSFKKISISVSKALTLVWSDDFNTDGAPDETKWAYDIGLGNNGWGNNELQYYTKRPENVIVKDGVLKITAKKESYKGSSFTSTRLKTQDKYDFTYGKVEIRAKLPTGIGTWPALWSLGSNITSVGWPACGEIDLMEHVGSKQGIVQSTTHTTSNHGGNTSVGSIVLNEVSTQFHIYAFEWSKDKIEFSVDGTVFHSYQPTNKNTDNWPFDANQFIIMNIAIGGTLGGNVDANFTSSSMEIDYIKVYQ
jgi:beta-glucanase (GH16 family)